MLVFDLEAIKDLLVMDYDKRGDLMQKMTLKQGICLNENKEQEWRDVYEVSALHEVRKVIKVEEPQTRMQKIFRLPKKYKANVKYVIEEDTDVVPTAFYKFNYIPKFEKRVYKKGIQKRAFMLPVMKDDKLSFEDLMRVASVCPLLLGSVKWGTHSVLTGRQHQQLCRAVYEFSKCFSMTEVRNELVPDRSRSTRNFLDYQGFVNFIVSSRNDNEELLTKDEENKSNQVYPEEQKNYNTRIR